MERIKQLIREVLSTPPKKESCNCGCHSCKNVGNKGPVLNESLNAKIVMTENMKYHVDNKLPLTENTFRYGSESFINLWAEARSLYLREIIHVNEDDKEILEETDLGNYGLYEGVKVPLDMPVEDVEWPQEVSSRYRDVIFKLVKVMPDRAKYELIDAETGKTWEVGGRVYGTVNQLKASAEDTIKPQGGRQSSQFESVNEATEEDKIDIVTMDVPLFIRVLEYAREDAQEDMDLYDLAEKAIAATKQQGILSMDDYDMLIGDSESLNEQSLDDQAKAYFLAKVKRGEINTLPKDPKAAFLAQMMKDQMDHDKETLRRERGLEERISKALNELNEELCAKGKRYIKARKRAGEKSSAYLSGRAVKVCKGSIKWPKKGRKKVNESDDNGDEEKAFDAELMATANGIASALGKELKAKQGDKEKLDEAIITTAIVSVLTANTLVGFISKMASKLFKKLNFKKGEDIAEKIHKWAHDNETAFQAPIKRILKFFIKDEQKLDTITKAVYAIVVASMAAGYGAEAVSGLAKADWFKGALNSLKAIAKSDEAIVNAYPAIKSLVV